MNNTGLRASVSGTGDMMLCLDDILVFDSGLLQSICLEIEQFWALQQLKASETAEAISNTHRPLNGFYNQDAILVTQSGKMSSRDIATSRYASLPTDSSLPSSRDQPLAVGQ